MQAFPDIDVDGGGIRIGAGGVIDDDRRILNFPMIFKVLTLFDEFPA
jgi:hypothetical protein